MRQQGVMIEHRVDGVTRMRVYVSGDTLTGDHISEIARREPDIDVAVMHRGGTRVLLHTVTMDAGQGVDFLTRLRPHQAVPVHYDDYGGFRSPLSTFEDATRVASLDDAVTYVLPGETLPLPPRRGV
jgi:L-ascorbate metabolism protein UlaG (beta-lactamase superfamily)